MKKRTTPALALTAALGAGLLLAPATAAVAHDGAHGCEVTDGTLTWGVIERWRSYVSGTIANGSYEPVDGAEYVLPNFVWKNAAGEIDPETGAGHVSFVGGAHFMGHSGSLDTTFANPTIEFAEDGTAKLLLDVKSLGRDGDEDTNAEQVDMGDLGAVAAFDGASGSYALDAQPALLTQAGSDVFTAYEPGLPMDPINLTFSFACEEPQEEATPVEEETEDEKLIAPAPSKEEGPSSGSAWLAAGIGGGSALLAAIVSAIVVRRKKAAAALQASGEDQPSA